MKGNCHRVFNFLHFSYKGTGLELSSPWRAENPLSWRLWQLDQQYASAEYLTGEVKEAYSFLALRIEKRRAKLGMCWGLVLLLVCASGRRWSHRDLERCHIQVNLTTCHNQAERGLDICYHSLFPLWHKCRTESQLSSYDAWYVRAKCLLS